LSHFSLEAQVLPAIAVVRLERDMIVDSTSPNDFELSGQNPRNARIEVPWNALLGDANSRSKCDT
jgi:hypothetical protein